MTVYVDNAVFLWRGRRWAHLLADDLDELHVFAARLGIPRRAFQDKRSGAHYDIDTHMREQAIELGAVAVSRHEDHALIRRLIRNAKQQWSGASLDADSATNRLDRDSDIRLQENAMARFDLTPPNDTQRTMLAASLSPEERRVLLAHGTEAPFCGTFLDNKKDGIYTCRFCGLPLFHSHAKFDSGTGWPSFFAPFDESHIGRVRDISHGMLRIEIVCGRCGSHLGHVFPDGPPPTGERHCLNSVSLGFVAEDEALPDPLQRNEQLMAGT